MEAGMRNDTTVFVGLDVHKESIVAAYAIGAGEIQDLGNIGILQRDLDRLCARMRTKGSLVRFVYEAGPCGYSVHRYLTAKGFVCTVCAPSLIARKPGDRIKTDRRDAQKLVKAARMNDLSAVHVPDAADEAFDVRYTGKANWNDAHRRWLARCDFPHANSHLAFQEHLHSIDDRLAQCERLERLLREAATEWRFYPVIQALQAMRGVQFTVAVGLLAEIGEFSRFETPRQLMAWLGLVPSEYSSGPRKRQGAITKCGNGFARRLLIEAAWAYRYPPKVSPTIQKRHEGIPRHIVDRAWDAQLRLCKRFRKLTARGKPHSIALVAVARELSGFIWDIARLTAPIPNAH
jgi:transposase